MEIISNYIQINVNDLARKYGSRNNDLKQTRSDMQKDQKSPFGLIMNPILWFLMEQSPLG